MSHALPLLDGKIDLKYAGVKFSDVKDACASDATQSSEEPIIVDGQQYSVQNGYLVPFYKPLEQDLTRRNEELVVARTQRFFDEAENRINIPLTREELVREMDEYKACSSPERREIKAHNLVGAMVNRMERLARAFLQKNIEGIRLEIHPTGGSTALSDEEVRACKAEFVEYYMYLISDTNNEPIRWVRRHDLSTDRDGVLLDIVREMGKPLSMSESKLHGDILKKIGWTMEAIDETRDQIMRLLDSPDVATAIDRAYRKGMPLDIDEDVKDKTSGTTRYRQMVEELTGLCRARSGLKSEDRPNFDGVREEISLIDRELHEVHKLVRELRNMKGQSHADVVAIEDMLRNGAYLMKDMAFLRLPRNHKAQDVYDKQKSGLKDASSVGCLTADIDQWIEQHQSAQIASR